MKKEIQFVQNDNGKIVAKTCHGLPLSLHKITESGEIVFFSVIEGTEISITIKETPTEYLSMFLDMEKSRHNKTEFFESKIENIEEVIENRA